MPTTRAQVILKTVNQVSEDYVTNSFAFGGAGFAQFTKMTTELKLFYDSIRSAVGFPTIAQNGHEIKFYDVEGPPPNYPQAITTWNFATAPAGATYASECAIALSFQGVKTPGLPQSRRRGRVYLGPCSSGISSAGRPVQATLTTIANAAIAMKANLAANTPSIEWQVWSVRDGSAVAVDNGWLDDAWDIQRRRGIKAISRTTWN